MFIERCGTNGNYANQKGRLCRSTSTLQTTGENYLLYDTNGTTEWKNQKKLEN